MESQISTGGDDGTPIQVPGVSALAYRLEGHTLVACRRSVGDRGGEHDLGHRAEPGWLLDEPAVELAFVLGAERVQVRDVCTGAAYECAMERCFRRSTLVKCPGRIRLRRLPLPEWTRVGPCMTDRAAHAVRAFGAA